MAPYLFLNTNEQTSYIKPRAEFKSLDLQVNIREREIPFLEDAEFFHKN